MASVFRHVERHHHEVPDAYRDLLLAAGAQVRLPRLERVDERDLETVVVAPAVYPSAAHNTKRITTTKAAITST